MHNMYGYQPITKKKVALSVAINLSTETAIILPSGNHNKCNA